MTTVPRLLLIEDEPGLRLTLTDRLAPWREHRASQAIGARP